MSIYNQSYSGSDPGRFDDKLSFQQARLTMPGSAILKVSSPGVTFSILLRHGVRTPGRPLLRPVNSDPDDQGGVKDCERCDCQSFHSASYIIPEWQIATRVIATKGHKRSVRMDCLSAATPERIRSGRPCFMEGTVIIVGENNTPPWLRRGIVFSKPP
jgi:hypothetical protein